MGPDTQFDPTAPQTFSIQLLKLYNNILLTGTFPEQMMRIKLYHIHKKGDKLDPRNYRPIALLSNILKPLVKLVARRINTLAESMNIFSEAQFGFRKGKSTTDAIYNIIH